jgi:hypothetical protein
MTGPMTVVANFTSIPEQVSTPTTPKNVTNGFTGTSYTFSSKSTSNLHNPVQYQYNWGDNSPLVWGPATQSHFWINAGTYYVTVTAQSTVDPNAQAVSLSSATVIIQQKPFIHITSPNGGETWVVGATHPITWNSNYLYYWFAGAWRPIASQPASLSTSSSYNWTVPPMPPSPPGPDSLVPKSHMSWTSVYIGNWVGGVNGTWQCWDTNDQAFKILENGWAFTISGTDKGGAVLFFNTDEISFDGYGISLNLGGVNIQGSYTVGANGLINGTYTLYYFPGYTLPIGTGNISGTLNLNGTKMTLTLKDQNNAPVFNMSGVWLSELTMPEEWSVQISGSVKGTISPNSPLRIVAVQDSNNEVYANFFYFYGSGTLSDGATPISIEEGYFFFTPLKTSAGNVVYGVYYQLIIGANTPEAGTLSGTLNPSTGKFTFNLTSSNGNKYTFVGVATP